MGPEWNILVNSPISTFQQSLTHSVHSCICTDCKSEFIPMSVFLCDIIELSLTDLNSHIWHLNLSSSCLDLRGASKHPLAGILLSQMLHWRFCPSCTVFTWKDKVTAVEKLELHCQHWKIRATLWALKTYNFVFHEFMDIQSCWYTINLVTIVTFQVLNLNLRIWKPWSFEDNNIPRI